MALSFNPCLGVVYEAPLPWCQNLCWAKVSSYYHLPAAAFVELNSQAHRTTHDKVIDGLGKTKGGNVTENNSNGHIKMNDSRLYNGNDMKWCDAIGDHCACVFGCALAGNTLACVFVCVSAGFSLDIGQVFLQPNDRIQVFATSTLDSVNSSRSHRQKREDFFVFVLWSNVAGITITRAPPGDTRAESFTELHRSQLVKLGLSVYDEAH